ncbi:MAG: hypothetical protein M1835_003460 [Candelina submexicana]|nr:MAG: hypothetical protein M1835_003460 [Candelina submexicana]
MPSRLVPPDEFELLGRRSSSDSAESFDLDEADFESQSLTKPSYIYQQPRLPAWLVSLLPSVLRNTPKRERSSRAYSTRFGTWLRRSVVRRLCVLQAAVFAVIFALAIFTAIFRPSYNNPPGHYNSLRDLVGRSSKSGRANRNNERIFIAANIIDEDLIRGAWGDAVLGLIDLLGEQNVFLSVYENDSGPKVTAALQLFEKQVKCNSSIISEHLSLEDIPSITLPSGEQRVKRVAYLAEVRNRALRPLDATRAREFNEHTTIDTQFDKLLFLNDVVFSPLDAAQLLFSTNFDYRNGRTRYRAACSVDFINPFKFYDTYATRDLGGYGVGVPFFPWFSDAGNAESRQDVLDGKDAVRVRSCWGGMVAFEARWFQHPPGKTSTAEYAGAKEEVAPSYEGLANGDSDRNLNWHWNDSFLVPPMNSRSELLPIRFRSEKGLYWDASECCLINADLQVPRDSSDLSKDTGIFMNPYIRVAYDVKSFRWLGLIRRFERLYSLPHTAINHLVGLPWYNPRRTEEEGEFVEDKVWVDGDPQTDIKAGKAKNAKGSYQMVKRTAGRGGFCGTRRLQVIKEEWKDGEKMWEALPVPPT